MMQLLVFAVAVLLWGGLGVSAYILEKGGDATWKRRVFPLWLVGIAVVYTVAIAGLIALMAGLLRGLLFLPIAGALMALVSVLAWNSTTFCDACDGSTYTPPFVKAVACRRCGAALPTQTK